MSLSDLADEILNLISIRLNGFDNCSLWMASDSKLKERLVNNVITDFDIKYTIPGRYLWPGNFLKKLSKLSHLSLVVDYVINHLPIHNIEMFAIPTLKYLKLDFINSLDVIERNHFVSWNNPTGPTTSSGPNYTNLNEYYSNLDYLEIIIPWYKRSLSIDFLGCLPQNLHTLLIHHRFKLGPQDTISALGLYLERLPRTLTSIKFDIEDAHGTKAYLDFSKLPANLTNLDIGACLHQDSYHTISKNLKSLFLSGGRYDINELAPFLPAGLENLSVPLSSTAPTQQTFSHLENLESLRLLPCNVTKFQHLIANCPPKLKDLNLVFADITAAIQPFSNSLTTLALSFVTGVTREFIALLPQSLTDLTIIRYSHRCGFPFFSVLPRKLKSLDIDYPIIEKTSLLPDTLTRFLWSNSDTSETCDPSCFDRLPPKLETLILQQPLSVSVLKQLPSSMKRLAFLSNEVIDDEVIRLLPRGLKELMFDAPDNITNAGVADLPPYLESIYFSSFTNVGDDAIPLLPRSLVQLSLPQNSNLTDECIKHLPRKLTELSLKEATKITSKSFKYLPKYLQSLLVPKCNDWNPEAELPPFIKHLDLGNKIFYYEDSEHQN